MTDTQYRPEPAAALAPETPPDAHAGREAPLPVTFDDDLTPRDAQGRYLPHYRDAAEAVHFFAIAERSADSALPDDTTRELHYVRAQKTAQNSVAYDAQPVMPVTEPGASPWPLPALNYYLEEGDLATAQALARDTARIHDVPFPDRLPDLATFPAAPGWMHFDAALVLAGPQSIEDGHTVGVVDVYADHTHGAWAARYLPMGEFDTLDEALAYQQQTLLTRLTEDRASAFSPAGFNDSPAIYERIALAEADAALTDLLEQSDGQYPPDYGGSHEPAWEPLTSNEWDAYRDHVRGVVEALPDRPPVHDALPTAAPGFADDSLVDASAQPDAPYLPAQDFDFEDVEPQDSAPTWRLDIVPAQDPDGAQLGYSAVCVVDFADLAEAVSPDAPPRAQWLEVAQFQTEDRAQQFREDFMSLVGAEELGNITGPALAGVIAEDLEIDSQWQTMDKQTLEQLKAEKWSLTHRRDHWRPRLDEVSPPQAIEISGFDLDL